MKASKSRRHLASVAALAMAYGLASPALAQQAPEPAADEAVDSGEIIVTATLQRESLQKVPVAVSAYNTEALEKSGVSDVRSLQQITPSFTAQSSVGESNGTNLRIRGVGTFGINGGLESSVGVFVDGVYLSRPGIIMGELLDLEQVEVLRGPQGTLFGRNTSVGLLNIRTKKPNLKELSGWANASYGNYDLFSVQGGVSGPLSDTVAVGLSGAYRNRDGFVKTAGGFDSADKDRFLVRGQLYFEPSSDLSIRLIADYSKFNETCCNPIYVADQSPFVALGLYAYNGLPANGGIPASLANETAFANYRSADVNKPRDRAKQRGVSGTVTYDFGGAELTSITAYRDYRSSQQFGVPFNGLKVLGTGNTFAPTAPQGASNAKTFSQELRIAGTAFDDRFNWLIGGYYGDERILTTIPASYGRDHQRYSSALLDLIILGGGGALPPPNAVNLFANGLSTEGSFSQNLFKQRGETWSVFTNGTLSLTDTLRVNIGLRYGEDEKTTTYTQPVFNNPACLATLGNLLAGTAPPPALGFNCLSGPVSQRNALSVSGGIPLPFLPREGDYTFNDGRLSYTAKLLWSPTSQLNTYASVSRGFKSGGQNHDAGGYVANGNGPNFESEINNSYELGAKFRTRDGKFQINVAAFIMNIKNFQTYNFDGANFQIFNVPKAKSSGFEVETTVRPGQGFTLVGGVSYADARFPKDCAGAITISVVTDQCNFPLQNAPKWQVVAGVDWTRDIGSDLQLGLNANIKASSGYLASDQPVQRVAIPGTGSISVSGGTNNANLFLGGFRPASEKINLRASIGKIDGQWVVEGWVNNLTDEATTGYVFAGPFRPGASAAFVDEARTYGVTVRTKF